MESVIRTIYGMYLQSVKLRDSIFVLSPNTTLNEKFNSNILEEVPSGVIPSIKYITIGNGGHELIDDGEGGETLNEVYHEPIHASLYNHIPFIARPVSNDLSSEEMSKYRLKVKMSINSIPYYVYYMKVVELGDDTVPSMVNVYIKNDVTVVTKFVSDVSNLTPIPDPTASIDVPSHTDYMSVLDTIPFNLDVSEITEIINAYQLVNNTTDNPIISEIGICSGADKQLIDSNNLSYTEAAAVQINFFINSYYLTQDYVNDFKDLTTFIELAGLEIIPKY